MNQPNNLPVDHEIWRIIGALISGRLSLFQISEQLATWNAGNGFIAKYLTPTGKLVSRVPCRECDETCENLKWVKKLSDGEIVRVCPDHPTRYQVMTEDEAFLHALNTTFYSDLFAAMGLVSTADSFSYSGGLIRLGMWDTSSFGGEVYIADVNTTMELDGIISALLSQTKGLFAIIVSRPELLSGNVETALRERRAKCFGFDELFEFDAVGNVVFKNGAVDLFTKEDTIRKMDRQVRFIEFKEDGGSIRWYINGKVPTNYNRKTTRADHNKLLKLLATQYNAGGSGWVPHRVLLTEIASVDQETGKRGLIKCISVLRKELGIEIELDLVKGYRITGKLSNPKSVPNKEK